MEKMWEFAEEQNISVHIPLLYLHPWGDGSQTLHQILVCHCSYRERSSDSIRNTGLNSAGNLQWMHLNLGPWKSDTHEGEGRTNDLVGGRWVDLLFVALWFLFLLDRCKEFCSGHVNFIDKFVLYQIKTMPVLFSKLHHLFFIRCYWFCSWQNKTFQQFFNTIQDLSEKEW